jgi:uncharacterized protein (DUF952 family)
MKQIIYKVANAADWHKATAIGHFSGSSDDLRDGFIHLSSKTQLKGTLEKHFRGQTDLLLIAFEEDAIKPGLKWETSRGGDLFPHLYGKLPTSKALWERSLTLAADGVPVLQDEWFVC